MIAQLITTNVIELAFVFTVWYTFILTTKEEPNFHLLVIGVIALASFIVSLGATSVGISAYFQKKRIPMPNKYVLIAKVSFDVLILLFILWFVGIFD